MNSSVLQHYEYETWKILKQEGVMFTIYLEYQIIQSD